MRVFVADANLDMTSKEKMLPSTHVSGGVRRGALVQSRFPKRWLPGFGPSHFPLQGLQGWGKGTGHCREADEACTGAVQGQKTSGQDQTMPAKKQTTPAQGQMMPAEEQTTPVNKQRMPRGEQTMPAKAGWVRRRGRCRSTAVGQASKPLMLLGVDSSLRCRVVYLKAFNNPSTTLGGCSLRTLMDRFTSMCDVLVNAPCGCTWS